MNRCWTVDLGLIEYQDAWALQQNAVAARKAGAIGDVLLFCEHTPVITLGRNGKRENLLASENVLRQKGVAFYHSNRGGDITFHGPGQIVAYPILNLGAIRRDVAWYARMLEEAMIRTTAEFGISAGRIAGKTGIWTGNPGSEAKLGAIGVHISRWVTSHGFAYNVSTDLRYFDLIVPCGISGRTATSLEKLLERAVGTGEVRSKLAQHLGEVLGLRMEPLNREDLAARMEARQTAELTAAIGV